MMRVLRQWIIQFLLRNVLQAVTIDDILRDVNGKLYIGKKRLSEEEIAVLREEAEQYKGSLLWRLMTMNVRWIIIEKLSLGNSKDVQFGQAMIYNLNVLEQFLEKLKSKGRL